MNVLNFPPPKPAPELIGKERLQEARCVTCSWRSGWMRPTSAQLKGSSHHAVRNHHVQLFAEVLVNETKPK